MGEFDVLEIMGNSMMSYTAGGAGGELILATKKRWLTCRLQVTTLLKRKSAPRQNTPRPI